MIERRPQKPVMVMAAAVSAKISDIFFRRNSALQEEVGNISGDNGNDDFCDNQRQNRAAISRMPDEDQDCFIGSGKEYG